MAFVYWIHLPTHTNIVSEGYVGITSGSVERRFTRHVSASKRKLLKPTRITNCFKKYGRLLQVKTILEGSIEYCQLIENRLRPEENMGWNLAVGGASTRAGAKNSEDHIRKVAESNRGKKRSVEAVDANRERGKLQLSFDNPWQHPYSNKVAWNTADAIFREYLANNRLGRRGANKLFDIPVDSIAKVLNKIKSGWNPLLDSAWLLFKEQYMKEQSEASPIT